MATPRDGGGRDDNDTDGSGHGAGQVGIRSAWAACSIPERKQLVVVSVSGAMLHVGFGVVIPALPALSEQLGFGAFGIGLLLAAPNLARVLCNLPAGALVDRLGRVPGMVGGELLAAVGCLGTALGSSLSTMLPCRFLGGAGGALASAASAAYIADMTEQKHLRPFRGTIVGTQGGLVAVAYVVGPVVGGALTELCGAQMAYGVVAGLIAACAGAYATLPEIGPRSGMSLQSCRLFQVAQILREAAGEWKVLIRDPNQQGLFAANSALFLNYAALVTVLPVQAFHVFGLSAGGIGALFSVGAIIAIVVSPVAGQFADRYGRVPLVFPALLMCAVGCLGVAVLDHWEFFLASCVLWQIGEAVLVPLLTAYAADIAPKMQMGSALAMSRMSGDLVFFLAPPVLGLLYDVWRGPSAMASTAVLTLAGGIAFRSRAKEVLTCRTTSN